MPRRTPRKSKPVAGPIFDEATPLLDPNFQRALDRARAASEVDVLQRARQGTPTTHFFDAERYLRAPVYATQPPPTTPGDVERSPMDRLRCDLPAYVEQGLRSGLRRSPLFAPFYVRIVEAPPSIFRFGESVRIPVVDTAVTVEPHIRDIVTTSIEVPLADQVRHSFAHDYLLHTLAYTPHAQVVLSVAHPLCNQILEHIREEGADALSPDTRARGIAFAYMVEKREPDPQVTAFDVTFGYRFLAPVEGGGYEVVPIAAAD